MRQLRLTLLACGLLACSPSQSGTKQASSTSTPDPALTAVSAEFSRRLAGVHGTLESLEVRDTTIMVKWLSVHCDAPEGEVIDLLVSLKREHPAKITRSISAERTCDGATRTFTATAEQFEQYRSGQINDPEILKGFR